ncbi:MAG: hypothetical protein M3Q74_06210 [Pseudomonadota bacterium]|nr:hypothetical protein [Pseudomonadota bacterium]
MPVSPKSRYKTVSMVLTAEQVRRLEAMRMLRSSALRDASKSEVIRDVVEAGLASLSAARDSSFAPTTNKGTSA